MDSIELTVLMPCLNEAKTIGSCIEKAQKAIAALGIAGEVLVSDNGSEDGSQKIATARGARVIHATPKGYGSALQSGIEEARGKYIIMGDADESYDWSAIAPFYEKLAQGYELVMGCRFPSGGGKIEKGAMPFLHRWLGNPILSFLGRILFKSDIRDFHCGMRGFNKASVSNLGLVTTGMEFASEMIIKCELSKLRSAQVPITLRPDKRGRSPHLRTWRDGWRHLRFMLLHSPKWVFLVPGTITFILGAIGFSSLIIKPDFLPTGALLACGFLLLIGLQWVCFGLSARIFGTHHGLIPNDKNLSAAFDKIKLETGCIIGLLSLIAGFLSLVYATQSPATHFLRYSIPGFTLLASGIQIILSSFFFSVLGLKYSKKPPETAG